MREIVLDTETTGLSTANGHRLTEIGCVELIDRFPTGNNFHIYINPERDISYEAYKITGLTNAFLSQFKPFKEQVVAFLEYIKNDTLIIHNATFDMRFINYELSLLNILPLDNKVIDTLPIARKQFPGKPANLDALCQNFNIDRSNRTKHGALLDAKILSQVYLALIRMQQKDINYDNIIEQKTIEAKKIVIHPNDKELSLHKEMLLKLKDNIWQY